jgi:aminoglycoside 2'-N-acetyltransferase I
VSTQPRLRALSSAELNDQLVADLRSLLLRAFEGDQHGGFDDDDWQHALGGTHFVLEQPGTVVAHASVVERELHVAGVPIRTGYVEAVATRPERQGEGHGSVVMEAVNRHIRNAFDLGGLGTGSQGFYERLGWRIWRGPTYVRTAAGLERSADEDGYVMVLETPTSPSLDLDAAISCEWRPGDSW